MSEELLTFRKCLHVHVHALVEHEHMKLSEDWLLNC